LKQKIINWLRGRYGIDELGYALLIGWMVMSLVNAFVSNIYASVALSLLTFAASLAVLLRMLSKNYAARRRENSAFLKIYNPIKTKLSLSKRKFAERKTHRYIKCPKCKAVLRLPYVKGTHTTNCPKCRERFEVEF